MAQDILPPLRLMGAQILRDGALQRRSLAISGARIARGPFAEVDVSGLWVLPGMVDLGYAPLAAPISVARMNPAQIDADVAATGASTAQVLLGWGWQGAAQAPDVTLARLQDLADYRPRMKSHLRAALRAETLMIDAAPRLLDAALRGQVDYVVFADGLEAGFAQYRADPMAFAARALAQGMAPDDLYSRMNALLPRRREVPRSLCQLAEAFDRAGTIYGSHADPDGETREYFGMIGAHVCDNPASRRAAAAAHAMMCPVVLSAPALFDPARASAAEHLVLDGLCDALQSDGGSLIAAFWRLVDMGLSVARAWDMVSANPADILRLPDRGRLDRGMRADVVIIDPESRQVAATISAGRLTYAGPALAGRFDDLPGDQSVAAA
ncbi:MAG: alkylphosphonate utilization protein [Rhodobacteraceae bacterium]|nr:alkylphosphonate utilization protein [Paracoccaceae bacterium]